MRTINDLLMECEAEARANGWEGAWEPQPADIEWIARELNGRPRLTIEQLAELEISPAFRAAWSMDKEDAT